MILIKDNLEFQVKSSVLDSKGWCILIDATVQGSDFLLVNIYAPNKVQGQCEYVNALAGDEKILFFNGDWIVGS